MTETPPNAGNQLDPEPGNMDDDFTPTAGDAIRTDASIGPDDVTQPMPAFSDDMVKIEDLSGFVVPRELAGRDAEYAKEFMRYMNASNINRWEVRDTIASHDSRDMAVKMMEWMNERHSGQSARMSNAQMMSYWRNSPRPKSKPKPKRNPWSGMYK